MSANKAELLAQTSKRTARRSSANAPRRALKKGPEAQKEGDRLKVLKNLAQDLCNEINVLEREKALADFLHVFENFNPENGIDFFDAVQRFEINLIKLTLKHTGGNQARAARLLRIRPTTLNNKIKLYGI